VLRAAGAIARVIEDVLEPVDILPLLACQGREDLPCCGHRRLLGIVGPVAQCPHDLPVLHRHPDRRRRDQQALLGDLLDGKGLGRLRGLVAPDIHPPAAEATAELAEHSSEGSPGGTGQRSVGQSRAGGPV
jgi:hypothetical protein